MTPDELQAIRERCDRATPGPWYRDATDTLRATVFEKHYKWDFVASGDTHGGVLMEPADWDFIVSARTDVPALLAEVERLQAEIERLRGQAFEQAARIAELLSRRAERTGELLGWLWCPVCKSMVGSRGRFAPGSRCPGPAPDQPCPGTLRLASMDDVSSA